MKILLPTWPIDLIKRRSLLQGKKKKKHGHATIVLNGMIRGDGYLSTWDIRKPDVAAMSDNMEDELLSVKLLKVYVYCDWQQ